MTFNPITLARRAGSYLAKRAQSYFPRGNEQASERSDIEARRIALRRELEEGQTRLWNLNKGTTREIVGYRGNQPI